MPKLKRDKSGQRTKEGKEHKESIVNGVTEAVEKYNYAYVFSFENMRNIKSNEIKQQFRHTGRFLLGLKKVIKVGLGGSASDEICPAIFTASKLLHGDVGLLIMDMPKEEVEKHCRLIKMFLLHHHKKLMLFILQVKRELRELLILLLML
ncbi:unnamed protein product [Brassica oleracea var. botrytis]|uniref:Uncharacterized protein n=1 Tax=Brassica carinata TaxID=52824 RepID=A0A8X7QBG2_BRACI|nr:mRNA turnover protein 4 homolog [Brassica napus]XP_048619690.1 mRNA turnover protein 4 homolog [Brassica napus]KAG2265008.1 hypothetical protein Bca52824_072087 [Brassica carinata]